MYPSTPSRGLSLALYNYGPDHQIKEGKAPGFGKDSLLVSFQQWSDIAFLSWASVTSEHERRNLRFVVWRVIKNGRNVDILRHMARDQGFTDGRIPVEKVMAVGPSTAGWLALSASPNVSGVCWLLI